MESTVEWVGVAIVVAPVSATAFAFGVESVSELGFEVEGGLVLSMVVEALRNLGFVIDLLFAAADGSCVGLDCSYCFVQPGSG